MKHEFLHQIIDKSILRVLPLFLLRTLMTIERSGDGRLFYITKNVNLLKVLISTVFIRSRKRILTIDQIKSVASPNSLLCFDIVTFTLLKLTNNVFKILEFEEITNESAVGIISLILSSKAPIELSTKQTLQKLKEISTPENEYTQRH